MYVHTHLPEDLDKTEHYARIWQERFASGEFTRRNTWMADPEVTDRTTMLSEAAVHRSLGLEPVWKDTPYDHGVDVHAFGKTLAVRHRSPVGRDFLVPHREGHWPFTCDLAVLVEDGDPGTMVIVGGLSREQAKNRWIPVKAGTWGMRVDSWMLRRRHLEPWEDVVAQVCAPR